MHGCYNWRESINQIVRVDVRWEKKKQHWQKPWIFYKEGDDVWHCSETVSISEMQEKKECENTNDKSWKHGVGVRYSAGEFGFYYKQSRNPLIV